MMNNDFFPAGLLLGTFFGFAGGILIGMTLGSDLTHNEIMAEAYSQGYAVQCLGKEGYYWECK